VTSVNTIYGFPFKITTRTDGKCMSRIEIMAEIVNVISLFQNCLNPLGTNSKEMREQ